MAPRQSYRIKADLGDGLCLALVRRDRSRHGRPTTQHGPCATSGMPRIEAGCQTYETLFDLLISRLEAEAGCVHSGVMTCSTVTLVNRAASTIEYSHRSPEMNCFPAYSAGVLAWLQMLVAARSPSNQCGGMSGRTWLPACSAPASRLDAETAEQDTVRDERSTGSSTKYMLTDRQSAAKRILRTTTRERDSIITAQTYAGLVLPTEQPSQALDWKSPIHPYLLSYQAFIQLAFRTR